MRVGQNIVQSFLQCLGRLTVLYTDLPHLHLATWAKDQHFLTERSARETFRRFFSPSSTLLTTDSSEQYVTTFVDPGHVSRTKRTKMPMANQ